MNLNQMATLAREHWKVTNPKVFREMVKDGELISESEAAAKLTMKEMEAQMMIGVPEASAWEASKELFIFTRIVLPLAKPIVATIAIFSFMWRWNDFLWPLIVISNKKVMTVQLALANFVGQFQISWASLLAMTTVTMIPMIAVFIFFQKYFIRGITAGGVKF